jgi:hypothetical protein
MRNVLRLFVPTLLLAGFAAAQVPRVGIVDFYGVRKVKLERLTEALGVHEGDPMPPSKSVIEERLEKVPGVVRARVEAVCCDAGGAILFVGIEEKGAPHSEFRPLPAKDVTLPAPILETYAQLLRAVERAARRGQTSEDFVEGQSRMVDPACYQLQQQLGTLAGEHLAALRDVLRNAVDDEQRAIAAAVLGYTPKKKKGLVVNDLQYALQDSGDSVRGNAARSLAAFAVLARSDPESGIRVSATWFVEMLNSIVWSDRNNACLALLHLTEDRNADVLALVRERALPSLAEMARWNSLKHALPAYILLGRAGGIAEADIHGAWERGGREQEIRKALDGRKHR